jgi:prepilin-type N-terminal cleavage/methylation domain-containing protein
MHNRSQKPGFSLVELLMALSILAIFFTVSEKIFNSAILLGAAGENLSNTSSRIDSALFQLRADVWNSKSISVTGPQSVDLTLADGTQITWKIDPDQGIFRTQPTGTSENWLALGKDWTFSTDNLSLTIADKSTAPTRLISQFLLAQRMRS